jgi:replicative DNA helicase
MSLGFGTRGEDPSPPPLAPNSASDLSLPWDEGSERAVLGAVLLDPSALDSALELISAQDFYRESHRRLFEAFTTLAARHEPIDPVTVCSELERSGMLDRTGGTAFVGSLIDGLPRTANVASYARSIRDRAILRRLLSVAEEIRTDAAAAQLPANEILDSAEQKLFALSAARHRAGFVSIREVGHAGLNKIEELSEKRELITGVPTGYTKLDAMTAGFQPGDLIILAARPSMGKTALALNIAQNAARAGASVGVFSLEMSAVQLFFRLLSGEGHLDAHKLRTGRLDASEWERLTDAFETLTSIKFFIDDTPGVTPMELRGKARRLAREHGLDLLIVDYLQLMRYERRTDSRQQEISEISRSLKGIAKELQIPVLALSQLSRAPEQRTGDHRPQLSDLRESGAIEQDADVVMFIFRPEVYEKDPQKIIEKDLEGKAELIIAKQRNGPIGHVPLYFVKQFTRFETREDFPGGTAG